MAALPESPAATWSHALPELVSLLLTTSGVEEYLDDLARVTVKTLDAGPLSCGVTLRRDRPYTVASSDALARSLDEVQYGQEDGPCLEALATCTMISSPDLAAETRWGTYPAHAIAHGVASCLCLPMGPGKAVGALNIYAPTPHTFDDPAYVARATDLAEQGTAVLTVLLRQAHQAELTAQLRDALASRHVIDQAIGIIIGQQRCSSDRAFTILRSASQNRNRKLRDVAGDIVTGASGEPPAPRGFVETGPS